MEQEQIFDKLLDKIKKNKLNKESGKVNSISFPFIRFSSIFPGWDKSKYYCFTANSGVGKTKITKYLSITSVYNTFKQNPHLKYKCFYFALEETKEEFWLGVISNLLYTKYNLIVSSSQLRSLGTYTVTEEILVKIEECKSIVQDMETYIEVVDWVYNPTGIYKYVRKYFENPDIGEEIIDPNQKNAKGYKYKDENLWVFIITDHVSLLQDEIINSQRMNQHQTMSFYSKEYCLKKFCKKFQCVTIAIQQQAADKEKQEYTFHGESIESKLEPSLDGLGNNKELQRDYDVVFGLFSPSRYNISRHRGYDIKQLGNNYRSLKVLKDRWYGSTDVYIPLYFNGAVNQFEELPKSVEINYSDYENR